MIKLVMSVHWGKADLAVSRIEVGFWVMKRHGPFSELEANHPYPLCSANGLQSEIASADLHFSHAARYQPKGHMEHILRCVPASCWL
jgi:hypothetical protein